MKPESNRIFHYFFQRTLLRNEQEEVNIKEEKADVKTGSEEQSATSSVKRSPAQEIFPTKKLSKKRKRDLADLPVDDPLNKVGCSSINNPP